MSMHSASGYAKRKIKLEKNKALSKILEKVPKINDLFKKKSASVEGSSDENQSCEGTPESAIIDIDPESAEVLPLNQSGFSNMDVCLRIFLSILPSNSCGERSFSVLNRLKDYLRSTMGEERLSTLAAFISNFELMSALDFEAIIDEFASLKARKKTL